MIDEVEGTLSRVRLAQKLGCDPTELTQESVDCPAEKIGRVIGKGGSSIKQIEEKAKVTMDVDSVASKIHLTGTQEAIQYAMAEIDRITMAVDEELHIPKILLHYLTTKVTFGSLSCRLDCS